MSKITISKRVDLEDVFECDVCMNRIKSEELGRFIEHRACHICKSCFDGIPRELMEAFSNEKAPKWKIGAAETFIFQAHESDDLHEQNENGYGWTLCIEDMKEGVWAAFENSEAEEYEVVKLDSILDLERVARRNEFQYRHCPKYLCGVLVNGVLRNFVSEWSLVELPSTEE